MKDVVQRGNTHMIVAHHVQTKRTFYSFVRHFKKLKDVENVSLILLGEEQFHHFIECLSSIHNLLKDFYPNRRAGSISRVSPLGGTKSTGSKM